MQPRSADMTAHRTIELNGFRCFWFTVAKKLLNGVALSRARVQNTRLAARYNPRTAMVEGMNARRRRPRAPPTEPVDWRSISVRGKRYGLVKIALRSLML